MPGDATKPELLLPVGNIQAFYAALEGGADAIYLGLKSFNARGRAKNFTVGQLQSMVKLATQKQVRVYVTLNTIIKNQELPELLDTLDLLSQIAIDAVIIQDWGTWHLMKTHFSSIPVHASTQMGNHNSAGVAFAESEGIERVILARELTWRELEAIREKTTLPLELFIHGALCYSFSGMCLFSSYLSGAGANRGLCAQPCRRLYYTHLDSRYLFSLKDNQQIERIPELMHLGIHSLKIEGRMKSAEYVYQVAKAYRMVIDNADRLSEAKEILQMDMGRAKTGYFLEGHVQQAMTKHPATGVFLGHVMRADQYTFSFRSHHPVEEGCRLRIQSPDGNERSTLRVGAFKVGNHQFTTIEVDENQVKKGDQIYLVGLNEQSFSHRLPEPDTDLSFQIDKQQKEAWIQSLKTPTSKLREGIYLRIDSLDWLRKIRMDSVDGLFLKLNKQDLGELNLSLPFLAQNRSKLWIELPKFVPEGDIKFYQQFCTDLSDRGHRQFVLSHLSQKLWMAPDAKLITNENVYTFNDAAIQFLYQSGISAHVFPLENDLENLKAGQNRSGIVPLYFYPELFYSRMPIQLSRLEDSDVAFRDSHAIGFQRTVRDGITAIAPQKPVSWVHMKKEFTKLGFTRFLIDLSYERPSQNVFKRLLRQVENSEEVQPSGLFNMKSELK